METVSSFLRKEQEIMIKELFKGFLELWREGKRPVVLCLNAPTGFGKTLIALYFSKMVDRWLANNGLDSVRFVFVRTRSQMSSFVRDSLKFFDELPSLKLNKVEVCRKVYKAETEIIRCNECSLSRRIYSNEALQLLDKLYNELRGQMKRTNIYDPYLYILPTIIAYKTCPYLAFSLLNTNIMVCTYPYLLNENLTKILLSQMYTWKRDIKIAIIDEAHNVENAYLSTDISISLHCLKASLKELNEILFEAISRNDKDMIKKVEQA